MHPGFLGWWKRRCEARGWESHRHAAQGHCVPSRFSRGGGGRCGGRGEERAWSAAQCGPEEGGAFGVRRPLRFLAYKLELREEQVAKFAAILNELKTERAQAAVDHRRRLSFIADALEGSAFDESKVEAAGAEQVRSSERLKNAVAHALKQFHAVLDDEQRKKLAYLLRTGVLTI